MATAGKVVVLASGKRGVLTGGKAAVFDAADECAACCAARPCTNCEGTQLALAASLVDACADQAECEAAEGAYSFDAYDLIAPQWCEWLWKNANAGLYINYDNGVWTSWVWGEVDGKNFRFGSSVNPVAGISCDKETGLLTGAFSLPGVFWGAPYDMWHCEGCTLNVTLGG